MKNIIIQQLVSRNLYNIGMQWYRNTFSESKEIKKSVDEDSKFLNMTDDYWDNINNSGDDDDRYHDSYSPVCHATQIYIENENLAAYSYFLLVAMKWKHAGGMTPDRGISWSDLDILLKNNITKKKR